MSTVIIFENVSEALFCLCRGTNNITFWGVSEFQVTYHGSLYLSFLSLGILIFASVRKTQEDTL